MCVLGAYLRKKYYDKEHYTCTCIATVFKVITIAFVFIEICQDVRSVKNGKVTYSGHLVGDTACYHCDNGYSIYGLNVMYCLASGRWTGKATRSQSK